MEQPLCVFAVLALLGVAVEETTAQLINGTFTTTGTLNWTESATEGDHGKPGPTAAATGEQLDPKPTAGGRTDGKDALLGENRDAAFNSVELIRCLHGA